ncbi:GIN domain-containing protein [Paraburkholderia sp. DHOC27]|uniref:GIN domain-containing protein n=1 Tax=Paraburkholderia sp. DHOC27 TaxID=2303330 RepID=UPI000E3D78B6|nr:DUF2807 domain-containing protein [Paraburkholderia sp. DHOC27]RFU49505.1 hypothetical protein D0B32_06885 [Paraburkholderia sp. DHOC27]
MQVRKVRLAAALVCSLIASVAMAQSGADAGIKTEARQTGAFSSVRLNGSVEGSFSISPTTSVTVSAPADVLPHVTTTVKDGVLTVEIKGIENVSGPVKVVMAAPALEGAGVAGSGSLHAAGLAGRSLALAVSGSGSIEAGGQVQQISASVAGSGSIDTHAIHAGKLVANVQGSGEVNGYAADAATVNVVGSGEVRVLGKPATRTVNRIGSGSVSFQ